MSIIICGDHAWEVGVGVHKGGTSCTIISIKLHTHTSAKLINKYIIMLHHCLVVAWAHVVVSEFLKAFT